MESALALSDRGSQLSHLVEPVRGPVSLAECLSRLQEGHRYLVQRGARALSEAIKVEAGSNWGSRVKRTLVEFPPGKRPIVIPAGIRAHNLSETVNQCASMERLIDALHWASANEELAGYEVECCHPTTSSVPGESNLVLVNPASGQKMRFEVSDVVGEKDGNGKEKADVAKLIANWQATNNRIRDRLFLVVSDSFANRLRPKCSPRAASHRYREAKDEGCTRIFEIVRGTAG